MAMAVPRSSSGKDAEFPKAPEKPTKKVPTSVCVKAESCYHVEVKLPADAETAGVDLIAFGAVAKILKDDKFEILRTWQEGDRTWLVWSQDFRLRVDRDRVIRFSQAKIRLQIWNSKDQLSGLARLERLKTLRLPQGPCEDAADLCGGVRTLVQNLRTTCMRKPEKFTLVASEAGVGHAPPEAFDLKEVMKSGAVSAEINPVCLLAGETSLTQSFSLYSSGVFEVMCDISLDRPLISDQLKAELNPLAITILSAKSLPPSHDLQDTCAPVYCQYKFLNSNVHRTNYHKHATNIHFEDTNVVLTGLMNKDELREFLSGPPLEIEVHDRDRKGPEPAGAFGPDGGHLKPKPTGTSSFGVAHLSLCELLNSQRRMEVHLPIRCCPPPQRRPAHRGVPGAASPWDVPRGDYVGANAGLKVKIEITWPFTGDTGCLESGGAFGRIIYLLHHNHLPVMSKLRSQILGINAAALQLGSVPPEHAEEVLFNYGINFRHTKTDNLDFVSGFHVMDNRRHIFVLEGLKDKAVRRLWESVPMTVNAREEEQMRIFYNSNLSFNRRIYGALDVALSPIHLSQPLEDFMKQPLLYTRGLIPHACFQSFTRLSQLCQAEQLKEVVQRNLFPSDRMIVSLRKMFHTERREEKVHVDSEDDVPQPSGRERKRPPLDTRNREYTTKKVTPYKNLIQENIRKVGEPSERSETTKAAVLRTDPSDCRRDFIYSVQTFSSKEQAKELLRQHMAQTPGRRFTYSQHYHSATVEPEVRAPRGRCQSAPASVREWSMSTRGDASRRHPKQPDEGRVEELREPWTENILHANLLKPTLSRDIWPWDQHHLDFQLYRKPPPFFSQPVVAPHLSVRMSRTTPKPV
ncbi:uncharacterized protein FLJ43738 isoform X2 [Takifugu rubripes]|uniref:uncharacterized protein FLJ43738 isoform X2 n=1 Tax=Takifugu rubripes TaxID=31033 RepID=UPI001145A077|nr:uncharacterized protein KIAA1257 homolog isoform X2 [Takifugu rubripes]